MSIYKRSLLFDKYHHSDTAGSRIDLNLVENLVEKFKEITIVLHLVLTGLAVDARVELWT